MTVKFARNVQLLLSALLIAFVVAVGTSAEPQAKDGKGTKDKGDKDKTDKNDPPGTAKYLNQLRLVFANWDQNDDGKVDAAELARVYRGPQAKAIEPSTDPKQLEPFADYQVFKLMDRNTDLVITRAEFDGWAKGQAELLAEQEEALERVLQKQRQLDKADPKGKNYDKMKADLRREREQAERLEDRIRQMQKQIQQLKRDDGKGKNDKDKKGK